MQQHRKRLERVKEIGLELEAVIAGIDEQEGR
jgi:hypothetical protein